MRKMKELLKKVFSLVIVTALIVTGVPTVAFYADTTVEEQEEVLSDVTKGESSNETITLDETVEKEEVLEEYQQYVEDGTYDECVAFMQELEVQKSNRLPKASAGGSVSQGAISPQFAGTLLVVMIIVLVALLGVAGFILYKNKDNITIQFK